MGTGPKITGRQNGTFGANGTLWTGPGNQNGTLPGNQRILLLDGGMPFPSGPIELGTGPKITEAAQIGDRRHKLGTGRMAP
jgi:hypothetical protein